MKRGLLLAMALLGSLSGCAASSGLGVAGAGNGSLGGWGKPYETADDVRTAMVVVGHTSAAALSWQDPNRVVQVVLDCYKDKSSRVALQMWGVYEIRHCMALDYLSYKDNQVATQNYRRPGNPFFSMDAATNRWTRYAPMAGFTEAEAAFEYMRATYPLTKAEQLQELRIRQGVPFERPHGQLLPPPPRR